MKASFFPLFMALVILQSPEIAEEKSLMSIWQGPDWAHVPS